MQRTLISNTRVRNKTLIGRTKEQFAKSLARPLIVNKFPFPRPLSRGRYLFKAGAIVKFIRRNWWAAANSITARNSNRIELIMPIQAHDNTEILHVNYTFVRASGMYYL